MFAVRLAYRLGRIRWLLAVDVKVAIHHMQESKRVATSTLLHPEARLSDSEELFLPFEVAKGKDKRRIVA